MVEVGGGITTAATATSSNNNVSRLQNTKANYDQPLTASLDAMPSGYEQIKFRSNTKGKLTRLTPLGMT